MSIATQLRAWKLSQACDVQIANLETGGDTYKSQFDSLFKVFMGQLQSILPAGTNIPEAYSHGSDDDQAFVSNLALFFTAFFKASSCDQHQQALGIIGMTLHASSSMHVNTVQHSRFISPADIHAGTRARIRFCEHGVEQGYINCFRRAAM